MSRPQEIWVRNDQGKVWGPLQAETLELMFESGLIPGKVQVSLDGRNFVFAGRLPEVRNSIPKNLWGDVVVEVAAPPKGVPIAGPGAVAAAARAGIAPERPVLVPEAQGEVLTAEVDASAAPTPPPPPISAPRSAGDGRPLPPSGSLEAVSAVHLYSQAAISESNALLTLTLKDRTVRIHFRKGNPDLIDSSHPDDQLGAFLLRQRLLTQAQLDACEAEKARFGGELLPALFGSGSLNPGTAFQHLAARAGALLQQAVLSPAGTFTFEPFELPAPRAFPLGNKWSLLTEAVRKASVVEVRRRLGDAVDRPVMKSGDRIAVADLRLTPQETRAFGVFDGVRSLNQLAHAFPQEADTLVKVAWYLRELGAVSFAGVLLPPPSKPAAEAAKPVTQSAPAPVAASGAAPMAEDEGAKFAAAMGWPTSANPAAPSAVVSAAAAPGPAAGAPAAGPGARSPVTGGAPPAGPVSRTPVAAGAPPSAGPGARPPVGAGAAPASGPGTRPPVPAGAPPAAGPGTRAAPQAGPGTAAQAAPGAKPSRPRGTPVTPTDYAGELPKLKALAEAMKKQNHFEVLGLPNTADGAQAKMAYLKLARTHHPDMVPAEAPEAYSKLKAEIFGRIGEANRTLTDDKLRAEYVELLKTGGTDQVDVAKILAAEDMFARAGIMVKARRFAEAVKLLDEAIEANPDEGEYYAWRGYAKFFAATDKRAVHNAAMADINICLKRNDKVAQAWYFQGHMAKVLNDLSGAKRHFQRCVALNPTHLEAQRELRMMK